jgi:hypothetical protein
MRHLLKQLKSLAFASNCFVGQAATKQFLCRTKPFWACGAELWKPRVVIKRLTDDGGSTGPRPGDDEMRTTSLILAFIFLVAGSSIAGSAEGALPGIGTFTYNGSPVATSHVMAVAGRAGATQ